MEFDGLKEEYSNEVNSIIDEYTRLKDDYTKVNNEIKDLTQKIKDLELKEKELSVDLKLNKEREKVFFDVLKQKDYKSFILIKNNIKDFISKKIVTK